MNKIIERIEADIQDVLNTKFSYSSTTAVPTMDDGSLTFGNGEEKKAKTLNTCVLFVDIRSSVALTEKHSRETMGKVYTAFTRVVLRAARYHHGVIRNIIGDRVMVVFPALNCFVNAVKCATTINHGATIINKIFKGVDFKCGIGIDYGELKVTKVGIPSRDEERAENRGLVWVGYPANIASRLTDAANKEVVEDIYMVTKNPVNLGNWLPLMGSSPVGLLGGNGSISSSPYLKTEVTEEMSAAQFASSLESYKDGELILKFGKFVRFEKKNKKYTYPSILITSNVYKGMRKELPSFIIFFKIQTHSIQNVKTDIYGANLHWKLN